MAKPPAEMDFVQRGPDGQELPGGKIRYVYGPIADEHKRQRNVLLKAGKSALQRLGLKDYSTDLNALTAMKDLRDAIAECGGGSDAGG